MNKNTAARYTSHVEISFADRRIHAGGIVNLRWMTACGIDYTGKNAYGTNSRVNCADCLKETK